MRMNKFKRTYANRTEPKTKPKIGRAELNRTELPDTVASLHWIAKRTQLSFSVL